MPSEEGRGCIRWPGLLTLPSSSPLRVASEVLHGSSSLDSAAAAAGGCLGPGPHACPCPVSWAQGAVGGGSEEERGAKLGGAKLEGASGLAMKGTALGRKAGA